MSGKNSTTRRAVAYYRASTLQQEASIPEQRDWCRQAAAREGLDLVAEFSDDGVAGSGSEKGPGPNQLLAFAGGRPGARRVSVVVCGDGDRLSRASSIRTAAVLDRLMGAGVTHLLTSEGWLDLEDEGDVLLHNVKQD